MISLPHSADLLEVARHVMWFEPPEQALSRPLRFLAYLMTYGTPAELEIVRGYVDEPAFREAIEQAPPGILDERSWAYWNIVAGHYPVPPMPQRALGGGRD
jgi:hypothetical protein